MNLLRMLDRFRHRDAPVVPVNPEHAHILADSDAVLADPRIKRLLSRREAMRVDFGRADRRLSGR